MNVIIQGNSVYYIEVMIFLILFQGRATTIKDALHKWVWKFNLNMCNYYFNCCCIAFMWRIVHWYNISTNIWYIIGRKEWTESSWIFEGWAIWFISTYWKNGCITFYTIKMRVGILFVIKLKYFQKLSSRTKMYSIRKSTM